jgi:hypothetical protein
MMQRIIAALQHRSPGMNFQERLIEASSELRARASALAATALDVARARLDVAGKRVDVLKESFGTLTVAGRALNEVAHRHTMRFVKENSALVSDAGKELGTLARSTYATLSGRKPTRAARKPRSSALRKRASAKAG